MNWITAVAFLVMFMGAQSVNTGHHRTPGRNPCLVSAWPMNEGSGLTLHDVSGNGNDATIGSASNLTWTFNAIKSGVTSPVWSGMGGAFSNSSTLANFSNTHPFSVAVWIKGLTTGDETEFLGTLNPAANFKGWEIEKQQNQFAQANYFSAFLMNSYPSNYIQISPSTNIVDGALHYLVMTYNGSSSALGVVTYIDGAPISSTPISNTLSGTIASGLQVWIAQRSDGTDPMIGALAYAEIYNCALTGPQVSSYYAGGPGIY